MQSVSLGRMLYGAGIGLTEQSLVKTVAEALGCLGHLFVDLFVIFGDLILDEHVSAIALF